MWFHLYEMFGIGISMKTESGLVVALGVVGVVITNVYQVFFFFFVGGDENIVNLDCSELDYEYTKPI